MTGGALLQDHAPEESVIDIVRRYLVALPEYGIHPRKAVLYGSHAKGTPDQWSDIDIIVVAPDFDGS